MEITKLSLFSYDSTTQRDDRIFNEQSVVPSYNIIGFNKATNNFELYDGTSWKIVASNDNSVPLRMESNETHLIYLAANSSNSNGIRLQQTGLGTASVSIHVLDGGGDAQIGFGIDDSSGVSIGHSWHMGVDNSLDDDFAIANGESISDGVRLYIDRSTYAIGLNAIPPTTGSIAGLYGVFNVAGWNALCLTNATTNNITKNFRYILPHFSSTEESMLGMMLSCNSSNNTVYLGGGSGSYNGATNIIFYTSSTITTLTGSKVLEISEGNKIGFFGKTPAIQQTKATHNNWASLADVVSALVTLGLFDST